MDSMGELEKIIFKKPIKNKCYSAEEKLHGRREIILPGDRDAKFAKKRHRTMRWRGAAAAGTHFPAEGLTV